MKKEILVKGPVHRSLVADIMFATENDKGAGGIAIFMGKVRDDSDGKKRVVAIEYSAYPEMVEKEADRISQTVMKAFSDVREVTIIHSVGLVKAGEFSLFIMISAGHRDQAMRACRHALEMIKENLPVWKKEFFDDETSDWK